MIDFEPIGKVGEVGALGVGMTSPTLRRGDVAVPFRFWKHAMMFTRSMTGFAANTVVVGRDEPETGAVAFQTIFRFSVLLFERHGMLATFPYMIFVLMTSRTHLISDVCIWYF